MGSGLVGGKVGEVGENDLTSSPDREHGACWGALEPSSSRGLTLFGGEEVSSEGRRTLPGLLGAHGGEGERPIGEVAPSDWRMGLPKEAGPY